MDPQILLLILFVFPDLLGKGGGEQKIDRLDFFLIPPPSLTWDVKNGTRRNESHLTKVAMQLK